MKCPRCVQRVHRIARQCPHCGFSIADVDQIFGEDDVRLGTLTDAAGVLRKRERLALRRMLRNFESTFPQLFFGIYFGTFKELPTGERLRMWRSPDPTRREFYCALMLAGSRRGLAMAMLSSLSLMTKRPSRPFQLRIPTFYRGSG